VETFATVLYPDETSFAYPVDSEHPERFYFMVTEEGDDHSLSVTDNDDHSLSISDNNAEIQVETDDNVSLTTYVAELSLSIETSSLELSSSSVVTILEIISQDPNVVYIPK
jgi:hypothetical protein